MFSKYTEDRLVEAPAVALFSELGWRTVNAYQETLGAGGTLGRISRREVVLLLYLRTALVRLNPDLPTEAIEKAVEELTRDRSTMSTIQANREVYRLVRDGVRVNVRQEDGSEQPEILRVVDWNQPENNEFLLVQQLWIKSDLYSRRADLVGFVNGLPLVFIELKASHKRLRDAYDNNLQDYRDTIPQIFAPNGFIILSNGSATKVGTVTSAWEHFAEWKKIDSETEPGVISLDTVIRGMCEKQRLLDLLENFIAFSELAGGLVKIMAKNHQYLGVNNAIARLDELQHEPAEERRRLGVFWHTQGSGKTMSMVFFSQKVLRTRQGNWTFVIITDRDDLDDQAYKEFTNAGVVTEGHVQASSGEHLKRLLGEDHRYVFTLIQKFHIERGQTYPVLSHRSDVVVMTDEAHRTQYDVLALNMRNALPDAMFLGFTGTPLIAGEERTRETFGDYVSRYDFGASVRDGATVPLFYENRIPELQLANDDFDADLEQVLEDAELNVDEEEKLWRLFGQQYHLITAEQRLDRVAADIVDHFLGRGFQGKAMVICIDKATAIRMFDKVKAKWTARVVRLKSQVAGDESQVASRKSQVGDGESQVGDGESQVASHKLQGEGGEEGGRGRPPLQREVIEAEIAYMEGTDMAVVVSQGQNEIADMQARGLDISQHRKRMVREDLEKRFKDPDDPLRMVFVCAMWTTGFDVPSCSTIYLDKPMKNHSLMQTIARANRVFPDKTNGLIVDYVGVFRNLEKALAIYAIPSVDDDGSMPVRDKSRLVRWLEEAEAQAKAFCYDAGVDLDAIAAASGFEVTRLGDEAVEKILRDEETKAALLAHARVVNQLFKAILPDRDANRFVPIRGALTYLAETINSLNDPPDVSRVLDQVQALLDESVAANPYVIRERPAAYETDGGRVDLSRIDWEALARRFQTGKKRTEAERLRATVKAKVEELARLNPTRAEWLARFQELIDEYNAGSLNVNEFFQQLVLFTQGLDEEEQRGLAEGLDDEQLAIYDLLTRPGPELTDAEKAKIKQVAQDLLETLKRDKLVLDWRKSQQARAAVLVEIRDGLDVGLPPKYDASLFREKTDVVFRHVYDSYWGDGRSVYSSAA
jgi:type I restriction enzyme, R subunit